MTDRNLATDADRLTYEGWAEALREGTLLGQRCADCEHLTAAPKAACARCGSRDLATTELPKTGEVYSETRLEIVPSGFDGPHHVALVALDDARVMAHVPEAVEIGQAVALAGALEVDAVAPVFEPI